MKRIVLAITLYISCMVVDYLVHYLNNRKKSSSPTTTQNSESYVVSCPASVKYVYMTIFALEIILFGVFLFLSNFKFQYHSRTFSICAYFCRDRIVCCNLDLQLEIGGKQD